jgi:RNA polymerase sigma-70 factor, ECF subfamily
MACSPSGPERILKPEAGIDPSKRRVRSSPAQAKYPAVGAEERELLERCRAGDTHAFRTLVERHHASALRLAFRIVRSERDAEEVAQDAFVRAWLGLREFRGDAAFTTWLYRIVVRRALDRAAQLRNRNAREADLEDAGEAAKGLGADPGSPGGNDPGEAESRARDARLLARLLDALPEAQRAAIALFYYEDLSVEEAARILEMPVGTVKTHLSRARAALRGGWLRESSRGTEHELR